jgi:PAS domain-containing protein
LGTHPDDREPVEQEIAPAIAEHRPFVLEYRIVHGDGSIRWVLERGIKTIDRHGVEWLDGIIYEITDRHAAEKLRREREMEALRVAVLEASRARIIEVGDAAPRRIECDLHDGAQQRLVTAALHLGVAERATEPDSEAARWLEAARVDLEAGLAELRELARGIHPAVLTDRGLSAAVRALAGRCTVPVEFDDALDQRLEGRVETALCYAAAEALTNVAATPEPPKPRSVSGGTPTTSSSRWRTTAAAAPTVRAARACVAWRIGSALSTASSAGQPTGRPHAPARACRCTPRA